MNAPKVLSFEEISEGQTAFLERKMDGAMMRAFADLTGDRNPLHVDDAFAAGTRFKGRIAHGLCLASLVSTLVGMELPGRDALILSQSTEFRLPVFPGDTVRVQVTVKRKIASARILDMESSATNQRDEKVMSGTVRVMVLG